MAPVFVIAEAGVNHNGSLDLARKLIDVAADAGADAVKFQTFRADRLVSKMAPKADYQLQTTGVEESQYEMIRKLELDEQAHRLLIEHCAQAGIAFLSTPFDLQSVVLLARTLDLPCIKISSGEITNAPLLLAVARAGKPVILSTGMCTLGEVEEALGVLAFGYTVAEQAPSLEVFREAFRSMAGQEALASKVRLLHCTTEYPAPFTDVNLRAMDTLARAFGLPVGFSDHTPGISMPIAAVARGAVVIEKHFTLDRNLSGPDHLASLEPNELKAMVRAVREVESALGDGRKLPANSERRNIQIARKSLIALSDLQPGEVFTVENLGVKRPGGGVSPMRYWEFLGRRAGQPYVVDEQVEP